MQENATPLKKAINNHFDEVTRLIQVLQNTINKLEIEDPDELEFVSSMPCPHCNKHIKILL